MSPRQEFKNLRELSKMNSRITDVDSRSADFSLRRDTFGRTLLGIPLKGKEVWERWMIKKKKKDSSKRKNHQF